MALTIHCFFSDGYSERGGMYPFLKKWNDRIDWIQVFPSHVKEKPGPKPGTIEKPKPTGSTGKDFISRVKKYLVLPSTLKAIRDGDYILLVDDADCRFSAYSEVLDKQASLESEFKALTRKDIRLRLLLASPELEAWFYADWKNSISLLVRQQYRERFGWEDSRWVRVLAMVQRRFRKILKEHGYSTDTPEWSAMPYNTVTGTCTYKFSSFIGMALDQTSILIHNRKIVLEPPRLEYKKDRDGSVLLKNIDPARVSQKCKVFFAPVYEELSQLK
ncbi:MULTISPECIES: hypothetical protein [Cohnella]|uniref:hypothetical protein n=1 Tax=Cohnella TaxID=329857 RepID=UPI00111AE215|nr:MULTISPECIES: hypothetical protein [Cohnella]MBN2983197.1 hypothetical protein [Cohnella algarum]